MSVELQNTATNTAVYWHAHLLILRHKHGNGISKNDLKLSVQRHATSKLNERDLCNINFLGFRGEALPSIASVSNLKIESIEKNKCGWVCD